MIRENGGWNMFRMIEIEKYPCNDKREADKRETEIMKELKATLNMVKSYATEAETKERKRTWNKNFIETKHYNIFKTQGRHRRRSRHLFRRKEKT